MILPAFSATTGAPLSGLTPVWVTCLTAATGAAAAQPTFTPLTNGQYVVTVPDGVCGVVDFGATAGPRYAAVGVVDVTLDGPTVVAAFALAGTPLAGLTPVWHSWVATDGTGAATPQPGITPLSGGLYRLDDVTTSEAGVLDFGATASPRYLVIGEDVATDGSTPPPTFPDAPLADWIAQAVTIIEALVPGTVEDGQGAAFEAVDGLLEIADEPQIRDRCFDVELVDSGATLERWGDDYAQRLARVDVALVYTRGAAKRATMSRIHEDIFAISARLEDSTSYGNTRIQRVTYTGGASITPSATHRIDVRLPFEILYLEPL